MSFRTTKINLSPNQQKRLMRGLRSGNGLNMRISAQNMRGNLPIKVTTTQMNKMNTARRVGKGMILKLSARQMNAMTQPVQGGIAPLIALLLAGLGGVISGLAGVGGKKLGEKIFGKGHASSGPQSGKFLPRASNLPRTATPRNLPITSPILRPGNIFEPDIRDLKFAGASKKARKKRVTRGQGLVPLGTGVFDQALGLRIIKSGLTRRRQRKPVKRRGKIPRRPKGFGLVPLGTGHIPLNLRRQKRTGFGLTPLGVAPRRRTRKGPLSGARPRDSMGRGFQVLDGNINSVTFRGGQSAVQQLIRSLPGLTTTQKKRLAK